MNNEGPLYLVWVARTYADDEVYLSTVALWVSSIQFIYDKFVLNTTGRQRNLFHHSCCSSPILTKMQRKHHSSLGLCVDAGTVLGSDSTPQCLVIKFNFYYPQLALSHVTFHVCEHRVPWKYCLWYTSYSE